MSQRYTKKKVNISKTHSNSVFYLSNLISGSVFKGWEGAGAQPKGVVVGPAGRKTQKFSQQERLFSYSSTSANFGEDGGSLSNFSFNLSFLKVSIQILARVN